MLRPPAALWALTLFSATAFFAAQTSLPTFREPARPARKVVVEPSRRIAVATERIGRNMHAIHIYRAKRLLELPPFLEILVATPQESRSELSRHVGERIAVVRSAKQPGHWEVYANVGWAPLDLPENVLVVKQVISSTEKQPIEVRVNGEVHRLKSGEVLVILG